MPRARPPYSPEFQEAVRLVRTSDGQGLISMIARRIGVSAETLRKQANQTEIDTGEREELCRLRHESRVLEQEKEVLREAAAFFTRKYGLR